ncbi:MAG: type II toxin-antitoxin system RelE/ParE family toxin [Pikeienuella sp.]
MHELTIAPKAREDLLQIGRYTQQTWGVTQRLRYLDTIDTAFRAIANNPTLGQNRSALRPNLLSWPCQSHLIFFRVGNGKIEILRILQQRMDFSGQF